MKLVYKKNKQFNGPVLLYKRMKEGIMDACETITTGSHTITVAIGQTETCYILQDRSAYIYKCACGKTERHYFSNGVSHSNPKCPNH